MTRGVAGLGALAVVALLWWTLQADADADADTEAVRQPEASSSVTAAVPVRVAIDAPSAEAHEASALLVPAVELESTATAEPEAFAPAPQPLRAAGRVTDAAGNPLEGVDAWLLPTGETLVATGTPIATVRRTVEYPSGLRARPTPFLTDLPVSSLPHARSDANGEFRIAAQHVPTLAGDPGDFPEQLLVPTAPQLLLAAPGWTSRIVDGALPRGEELALGSYMLEPEARIEGRVVDADGHPLPDVRVRFAGGRRRPREAVNLSSVRRVLHADLHEVHTDAQGRFSLGGLWCGHATLELSLPGFLPTTELFELSRPGVLSVDDLVLERGAELAGRVLDADGAPLPDADVVVTARKITTISAGCLVSTIPDDADRIPLEYAIASRNPAGRTRSDADGRFALDALDGVNFAVYVRAAGHEWARATDVPPGEAALEIRLARASTLELRVVDALTGAAIPHATATAGRLSGASAKPVDLTVEPHDAGLLVHQVGPIGTQLTLSAPGYAQRSARGPGVAEPGAHAEFVVELQREAVVAGEVRDTRGAPIPHAEVTLRDASEFPYAVLHTARTGAAGAFHFERLQELDGLLLMARAPGHAPACVSDVSVAAGATRDGFELVLPRAASIEGTVFDADGTPTMYTEIRLHAEPFDGPPRHDPALPTTWLMSEENGGYAFTALPPGRYRLDPEHLPAAEFELAEGERVVHDLHQNREPVVQGRVLRGGEPVKGAFVQALPARGLGVAPRDPVVSDEHGAYRLTTERDGRYTLAVVRGTPYGDPEPLPGGVELDLLWGDTRTRNLIVSGAAIRVSTRELGTGAPRAKISIVLEQLGEDGAKWETLTFGRSDAEGRCAFEGLLPGTYRVGSDSYAYTWQHIPARSASLELDAEDSVDVTLELDRGAELTGEVHTAGGALAHDGGAVKLFREDRTRHSHVGFVKAGRYTVAGLRPGTYRVIAQEEYDSSERRDSGGVTITLAEREQRELDLVAE